jgi:hypothetical protein
MVIAATAPAKQTPVKVATTMSGMCRLPTLDCPDLNFP